MMVFAPVPSHTIKSGARADLGRLLSTTRYGSKISDSFGEYHNNVEQTRLNRITRRKLTMVSNSVMPMCESRALLQSRSAKQAATRLGLEKKKLSIQPRAALTSHKARNSIKIKVRQEVI